MKTKLWIFLMVFGALALKAQTHRFYYELDFRKDSLSNDRTQDLYVLDIDRKEVKFYGERLLKADSLMNLENYNELAVSGKAKLYPDLDIRLKRSIGSDENTAFHLMNAKTYYAFKTKDKQVWKLLPENKTIKGYKVQKATTQFGGRHWEAWFTTEIPFAEGPYKFKGLPGLILEIYDDRKDYVFVFAGNKTLKETIDSSSFLEQNLGRDKPIEISEKKYNQLKLDYYNAPFKDFGGNDTFYVIENGTYVQKKIDTRERVRKVQERLRKDNNPIELDKAVKYPQSKD